MFTPEYIENVLLNYLTAYNFGDFTGSFLKFDERASGGVEDITVQQINTTDGPLQLGACNVTIFVKDIEARESEQIIYKANNERFNFLTAKVFEALGGSDGKTWKSPDGNAQSLYINGVSSKFRNKESEEHFLSIRVQFRLTSY